MPAEPRRRRIAGAGLSFVGLLGLGLVVVPRAGAEPPTPAHDPAAVRELADEILARDEFQPPDPTLLDRIFDWIDDHLIPGDGDDGGSRASLPGTGGSGIVTAVFLVAAVVAIGWILRTLLRHRRRRRRRAEDDPATEIEVHRSASEWAEAAARHESEGRWKEGLRCRFRALVELLTDDGVVPEIAGRTSGELLDDVAAELPEAAEPFGSAVHLFERAWYGDLPTGAHEAAAFGAAADAVLGGLSQRRARREPAEVGG